MLPFAELLSLLSLASLGVFTGAMLTEGAILVPYWRSLPAPAFFTWYAANDRRLMGFFAPVTAAGALAAIAAALAAFASGHPGRWPALGAALLVAVATAMFPLYFQAANARFSAADIPPDELPAALAAWAAWHRLRMVLSVAALVAAVTAAWL